MVYSAEPHHQRELTYTKYRYRSARKITTMPIAALLSKKYEKKKLKKYT